MDLRGCALCCPEERHGVPVRADRRRGVTGTGRERERCAVVDRHDPQPTARAVGVEQDLPHVVDFEIEPLERIEECFAGHETRAAHAPQQARALALEDGVRRDGRTVADLLDVFRAHAVRVEEPGYAVDDCADVFDSGLDRSHDVERIILEHRPRGFDVALGDRRQP